MATLKVYDGTQWQVVAGQGSPGQGIPAGGVTSAILRKNSTANLDTSWTTSVLADNDKVHVNPVGALPAGINVQAPSAGAPALDAWARYGAAQTQQILRVIDQNGNVGWFVDKAARPKQFIQAATGTFTTDAGGVAYINFPEPFLSSLPTVVASEASNSAGGGIWLNVFNMSSTGFGFKAHWENGTIVANGLIRVNWFASEVRT